MKGYQIRFYTRESDHHSHRPIGEWLLEQARRMELRGATLAKASEGFGPDHKLHSARFFDLSDEPVVVTMVVSEDEKELFFRRINKEGLKVFYTTLPLEFGMTGS